MSLINDTVPSAESSEKVDTAYEKAKELLKANPELAGFTGAASVDILGEAQATEELGLTDKGINCRCWYTKCYKRVM